MTKAANVTIINPGPGVGPFTLYALDSGGATIQTIQTNVPLSSLIAPGLNVYGLPLATTDIRIQSENALCNNSYTVNVKTPPKCYCLTFSQYTEGSRTYSYTDCTGASIGPLPIVGVKSIQVCGSNPTVSNTNVKIIIGSACEEIIPSCLTGTLILQNAAVTGSNINIINVNPRNFYSFNTPATYPDSPTIVYPVTPGQTTIAATRIPYNSPITVVVSNTNAYNVYCGGSLFINGVLKESISFVANNGYNNAIFNQINPYTFNTTDVVKIVIFEQIG